MQQTPGDKVAAFFRPYPEHRVSAGETLVQAGEELPGVFYITKGQIRQYDIADNGEQIVVNVFKPPAFFPMSWAINRTPNRYFFETATDMVFQIAPAERVVEFLHDNPDVTFDLLARVYSGTDGLLRRMAHLMGGRAHTRLLFELLVETERFGKTQADGSYVLDMSEVELAKRSGLARETVSRELRALKDVVRLTRSGIVIADLAALRERLGNNL